MKQVKLIAVSCYWVMQGALADQLLPPNDQIRDALLNSPQINAALARRDAVQARAGVIGAGPAEFSVKANQQRRTMHDATAAKYSEYYLGVERPIRYWGKWSADADLALRTKEFGSVEYADTMHEASRELLSTWFNFLKARQSRIAAERNKELGGQLLKIVQARYKVGEISKLESELISAEHARLGAAYQLAVSDEKSFTTILGNYYPSIRILELGDISTVDIPAYPAAKDLVKKAYVDRSHELNLAKIDADRQAISAKRIGLDRIPDPTVGLYRSRELGGAEVVNGVSISIPIPGSGRFHAADAAYAEAESTRHKYRLIQQKVDTDFEKLWQDVSSKKSAALSLRDAAAIQNQAAIKAQKAYVYGEGTIADLIYSRKIANETQVASELMLLDAYQAYYRLRLDLHEIWDFD